MKKIYTLLLICIAAMASYAVAEETGVLDALKVTLRDGTVKYFKLADIETLTFDESKNIPDEPDPPVGPVTPPDKEFTSAPYAVGDFYFDGETEGVVVSVDATGSYGKLMAMTDNAPAIWSSIEDVTGAQDEDDGQANMAVILELDPTLEAYPAFKACADLGAAWYLPSLKELASIARMRSALNVKLQTVDGATTLTTGYYWSSTEVGSDAANSAYCVYMTDVATQMPSSKNVERKLRAIAIVGERPATDVTYAVGDPYVENDEVVGIVTSVTDGGKHGRVIALKNVQEPGRVNNAMWDKRKEAEYTLMGCDSRTDGAANLAAMRAADPELASFPAQLACVTFGEGWYMPAIDELAGIYPNLADINAALKANGGNALDTSREYWSSTEGTVERAASFNFKDGSEFNYRRYTYLCVRPMKAF